MSTVDQWARADFEVRDSTPEAAVLSGLGLKLRFRTRLEDFSSSPSLSSTLESTMGEMDSLVHASSVSMLQYLPAKS